MERKSVMLGALIAVLASALVASAGDKPKIYGDWKLSKVDKGWYLYVGEAVDRKGKTEVLMDLWNDRTHDIAFGDGVYASNKVKGKLPYLRFRDPTINGMLYLDMSRAKIIGYGAVEGYKAPDNRDIYAFLQRVARSILFLIGE